MIKRQLADYVRTPLRQLRNMLRHIPYRGAGRYCPVCKKSSNRFGEAGIDIRQDARCMYCGAVERHRLIWFYFEEKTDLFDGRQKNMLHVAPEPNFEKMLRKRLGQGYLTADLYNPQAMIKMDITDIEYPDDSFDVIYCSHVLEHVPDDRRAMRELHRVLKPDGWAVLMVPITSEETYEDPSITDPAERLKHFGQSDHVRRYGPDYVERLREAGFCVEISSPDGMLREAEVAQMGFDRSEEIYFCTKCS